MDQNFASDSLRFLLVEDHPIYLKGLKTAIEAGYPGSLFFSAECIHDAREILKDHIVNVITLDIRLPDGNGINFCKEIRTSDSEVKIICISLLEDDHHISSILEAGANGYLVKNADGDEICFAISQVLKGKPYTSQPQRKGIRHKEASHHHDRLKPMTDREIEVLVLICHEHTDKQISEKLHVSVSTVANHRHNLHRKAETKNTAGLVLYAKEHGLI